MIQYLELLRDINKNGAVKGDRTGTGTKSVFGRQMRFDMRNRFPLVTTKKMHTKSIIHELLWFIRGDTNIKYLNDNKVTIWDEWADENGDLGPVYGSQWRKWRGPELYGQGCETIDQLGKVIDRIKTSPDCRRLIVSAWNVSEIPMMKLAPCHCFFQFNTEVIDVEDRKDIWFENKNKYGEYDVDTTRFLSDEASNKILDEKGIPKRYLDVQMYQRSVDSFLGLPFNIASYAFLLHMVAQVTDTVARDLVWVGGDTHLYSNHKNQVELQISRMPYKLPTLKLNPEVKSIDDFKYEDFEIVGYECHPLIPAPISV